jgi:hypothetical protein
MPKGFVGLSKNHKPDFSVSIVIAVNCPWVLHQSDSCHIPTIISSVLAFYIKEVSIQESQIARLASDRKCHGSIGIWECIRSTDHPFSNWSWQEQWISHHSQNYHQSNIDHIFPDRIIIHQPHQQRKSWQPTEIRIAQKFKEKWRWQLWNLNETVKSRLLFGLGRILGLTSDSVAYQRCTSWHQA